MKKIIAILLALAVVSMAFAQTVSVTNELSTQPQVTINGLSGKDWFWSFNPVLKDQVSGEAITLDGRAKIAGDFSVQLNWVEKTNNWNILSASPRWKFTANGASLGALLKPVDHLELYVTNTWRVSKSVAGPGIKWTSCSFGEWGALTNYGTVGNGMSSGIYAGYNLLDDNMWIGGGLPLGTTWIKKGAYGPFQLGVNFKITDTVSVGARWEGQFGGYSETATDNQGKGDTDKKYQKHGFYVGADLNMFQDAKVGTKLGVGFSFNTEKASTIMDVRKNTMFAGTVKGAFDFQNGVSDELYVTVGWRNYDGKKAKVLPFCIDNTFNYKVSDDAKFSLNLAYTQGSLQKSKKNYSDPTYGTTNLGNYGALLRDDARLMTTMNGTAAYISQVHVKPAFEFKLGGKHTLSFGVETDVLNQMAYWKKTDRDWAYSTVHGVAARVAIPISWSYTFN